jgi:hypothetical protein
MGWVGQVLRVVKSKAVPLHAMVALGGIVV